MRTKTLSLYFYDYNDYNIFLYSTSISSRLILATVLAILPVATTYTLSTSHGMSFFLNPNFVRFVVRSRSCTIRRNASPSSEPSPWLNIRAKAPNYQGLHSMYIPPQQVNNSKAYTMGNIFKATGWMFHTMC